MKLCVRAVLCSILLFVAACDLTPVRDMRAAMNLDAPYLNEVEPQTEVEPADLSQLWWQRYEDEELNALMGHAFRDNPQINQLHARIAQAYAVKKQSQSDIFPTLDAQLSRNKVNGDSSQPSDFTLLGAAAYELDVWGKTRAQISQSDAQLMASEYDLYGAMISLSASIAENWLEILSLIEQERLLNKQIEINQTVLDLQNKRFEMGSASALDILQQQDVLKQSQAQLPDILSSQKQAANALALLLGRVPRGSLHVSEKPLPKLLPVPKAGLPSELLINRPDVLAAWERLKAADWAVNAAQADRLPSFNLSASFTSSAEAIGNLFNVWVLDLVGQVAAPIFDAGNRKARVLQQKALADERYHAYREVVLTAVNEVENALVRSQYQDQKIAVLEDQLLNAQRTLENAQLSYANGRTDYINVLSSLNSSQALERQLARERLAQAIERVRLYRALGGVDWAKDYAEKNVEEMVSAHIAPKNIRTNDE